jgi:hypothetical protein
MASENVSEKEIPEELGTRKRFCSSRGSCCFPSGSIACRLPRFLTFCISRVLRGESLPVGMVAAVVGEVALELPCRVVKNSVIIKDLLLLVPISPLLSLRVLL